MKKIMLSLACMFVLLIDCRLHAMDVGSRRFGELPTTPMTPDDCKNIEHLKDYWRCGDYNYPSNRILAAKALRKGCDQKFKDHTLHQAALFDDYHLAHHALEHGANPNRSSHGGIILFSAISLDIVKLLVAKGALLDARRTKADFTLLHQAACDDHEPSVLEYYIQNAEIPVNLPTKAQETPLHIWAKFNYFVPSNRANLLAKLKLLLNAGVDCERKDIYGQTALNILDEQERHSSSDQHIYRTFKTLISKKMREQQTGNAIPHPAVQEPELNNAPICAICYQLPNPNTTSLLCEHTYCTDCINRWFAHKGKQECPICKRISPLPQGAQYN